MSLFHSYGVYPKGLTPFCVYRHFTKENPSISQGKWGPKWLVLKPETSQFPVNSLWLGWCHFCCSCSFNWELTSWNMSGRKKEPMRIQWIQLLIWKAPQTHTIAFCCLIFNIDKHNCIYLSSQYWKQAIICNITTLHLKGIQAQQFPVPSKGGEWHRGGWIAYAGEAYIIIFFPMRIY